MNRMFKNMENTIARSTEPWFYKKWESRDMPTLGGRDYAEEQRIETERKRKEEADRRAKEEADRRAKEEADRKAQEEADRKAQEEADRKAKEEAKKKAEEAKRRAEKEMENKSREIDESWEESDNLKYIENIAGKTDAMSKKCYNVKLEAEQIKNETQRLENRMSEILNRYKINEGYEDELNEITWKFKEIRDKYRDVKRDYETILTVISNNRIKMEEFIGKWRILDRKNQRRLNELRETQNYIKRTTEELRNNFWELGNSISELQTIVNWSTYGVNYRYNWQKLIERSEIVNETKRQFEEWTRAANNISEELNRSRNLTEVMLNMSNQK